MHRMRSDNAADGHCFAMQKLHSWTGS